MEAEAPDIELFEDVIVAHMEECHKQWIAERRNKRLPFMRVNIIVG